MTRARARAAEPAWQQRRGQARVNLHQSLEIMLILLELGPQKFGRFSLKKNILVFVKSDSIALILGS